MAIGIIGIILAFVLLLFLTMKKLVYNHCIHFFRCCSSIIQWAESD